ncbi:MAG: PEP-CTERM sorting domain-containing protein [Pseudomonadota bacterium]
MKLIASAIAVFMAAAAAKVGAASFQFTFDIPSAGYTGGGTFQGELQPDGDTILNMADLALSYSFQGVSYANTGNPVTPNSLWSLSGNQAFWVTDSAIPGGMGIGTLSGLVIFGEPNQIFFTYAPSDFEITETAIPLPASLVLALAGLGALGWVGRRKPA